MIQYTSNTKKKVDCRHWLFYPDVVGVHFPIFGGNKDYRNCTLHQLLFLSAEFYSYVR